MKGLNRRQFVYRWKNKNMIVEYKNKYRINEINVYVSVGSNNPHVELDI